MLSAIEIVNRLIEPSGSDSLSYNDRQRALARGFEILSRLFLEQKFQTKNCWNTLEGPDGGVDIYEPNVFYGQSKYWLSGVGFKEVVDNYSCSGACKNNYKYHFFFALSFVSNVKMNLEVIANGTRLIDANELALFIRVNGIKKSDLIEKASNYMVTNNKEAQYESYVRRAFNKRISNCEHITDRDVVQKVWKNCFKNHTSKNKASKVVRCIMEKIGYEKEPYSMFWSFKKTHLDIEAPNEIEANSLTRQLSPPPPPPLHVSTKEMVIENNRHEEVMARTAADVRIAELANRKLELQIELRKIELTDSSNYTPHTDTQSPLLLNDSH